MAAEDRRRLQETIARTPISDEEPVKLSRPAEGVLQLTLSRPKARNAFTGQMGEGIIVALENASRDASVRAIVVTGDPEGNAFCAGADLNMGFLPKGGPKAPEPNRPAKPKISASHRDFGGLMSLAALRCTKPVIAAVNGAAVGIGLAFPLAMDIRIVAEDAKVGFPMAARGMVNESISSYLLPRVVGPGFAKELVFTGRVFRASEAPHCAPGLFNYILPSAQVLPKALELAQEIAANTSCLSVALCKKLMDDAWEATPEEAMLNESKCLFHCTNVKSSDVKEGTKAFLERRSPKWVHDAWDDLPDIFPLHPRVDVRAGRSPSLSSRL